jgi:hypothetical protein
MYIKDGVGSAHERAAKTLEKATRHLVEEACAFVDSNTSFSQLRDAVIEYTKASSGHTNALLKDVTTASAKTGKSTTKTPAKATPVKNGKNGANAISITFTSRTPPAFKKFMDHFVPLITAAPVEPTDALELAKKHGYKASLNTLRYQLDTYLGIRKFKDDSGASWWAYEPKMKKK